MSSTTESAISTSMDAAASSASISSVLASASDILAAGSSASASAQSLIASATGGSSAAVTKPASYKIIGIVLAVASGVFIGSSFVFKKKGLLSMQNKPGFVAGEGHAYLKSPMWWTGMTLMIIGEICNFVAYAFTEAILVTPLGALSVVICAILSSIFLKEKLTFFGKVGCVLCILGSVIIAMNGPSEAAAPTIKEFQKLFLAPGFLAFGSVIIVVSLGLIFWAGPRYGKKNMLVYIVICSLIGGLSVVCTSGLGSSILTSINGNNQFKHWFMYFLMGFVIITLLTEINYLNKALELFNTAMVTPTYFVIFTSATLVTDVVIHKGFNADASAIVTVVFGFFVICCGIVLLQMSKIDPKELENKVPSLDRQDTMLLRAASRATIRRRKTNNTHGSGDTFDDEKEQNLDLEDPGVDSIRGFVGLAGSIHRAISAKKTISNRRRQSHLSSIHEDQPYIIDENGNVVMAEGNEQQGRKKQRHGLPQIRTDGVVRHQLYDAPMPADAADRISQYSKSLSPASENGTRGLGFNGNIKSPTKINFDTQVREHLYPLPGKAGSVIHQQHSLVDHGQAQPAPGGIMHHHPVSEFGQHLGPGPRQPPVRRDTTLSNVTNSSFIDSYAPSPTSATSTSMSRPHSATRVASDETVTTAGSGRTATTTDHGESRSLTQSIMEHFKPTSGRQNSHDADIGQSAMPNQHDKHHPHHQHHNKPPKSPTARSFFSRGHGHRNVSDEEESMGLVGHGAEFAGSQRGGLNQHGRNDSDTFDHGREESHEIESSSSSDVEEYQMQESTSTPRRRL